jgi:hypothetical protein
MCQAWRQPVLLSTTWWVTIPEMSAIVAVWFARGRRGG